MANVTTTPEWFEEFNGKAIEGLGLWADANQKLLGKFVDLSAATAAETVRVNAELQSSIVQAFKSGQELLQKNQLKAFQKDPVGTYQKGVLDGLEGAQQALKLLEATAETVTKSAERLQGSAEQATKDVQATFATLGTQLKALYTPSKNNAG